MSLGCNSTPVKQAAHAPSPCRRPCLRVLKFRKPSALRFSKTRISPASYGWTTIARRKCLARAGWRRHRVARDRCRSGTDAERAAYRPRHRLSALGAMEAAEAHLNTALAINASHPVALNELGIVYRKTARFAEARQSYEAALAVYPGFHYARRNLAVLVRPLSRRSRLRGRKL